MSSPFDESTMKAKINVTAIVQRFLNEHHNGMRSSLESQGITETLMLFSNTAPGVTE